MNFKALFQSMLAAVAGGSITAVSTTMLSGQPLNTRTIGVAAAGGALATVAALLKQSPILVQNALPAPKDKPQV